MKFASFFRPAAACSLAFVLTACPPVNDEPDPQPTTLRQLAEAYVNALESCQPIGGTFFREIEPNYENEINITVDDLLEIIEAQANHPAYGDLNQQALDDCYEIVSNNTNLCGELGANSQACNDIFPGIVAEGEACDGNDQCVDGLGCKFETDCGTCVPLVDEGASCAADVIGICDGNAEMFCGDGDVCVASEPDEPEPELALGDTCGDAGCGLWYSNGLACVDSVCVAMEVATEGGECDFFAIAGTATRICRGSLLSRELFCDVTEADPTVGTCTATKAAAADCTYDFDCQSGLECNDDDVCAEPAPECVADTDCQDGAICEEGSCNFVEEESMCFDDVT